MKKPTAAAIVLFCLFSTCAAADVYTTVGGYYSKVDKPVDRAGNGGQFGIGYRLSDTWNFEFGYNQFIDQDPQWPHLDSSNNIVFESGYKSAGFALSVLGKTAVNDQNDLFYRVGVMSNKSSSLVSHDGITCADPAASGTGIVFSNGKIATSCHVSKTSTALLFGLGFDHHFSQQWFSRIEVIGLVDADAESITALKLAIGYSF